MRDSKLKEKSRSHASPLSAALWLREKLQMDGA